MFVKDYIFENTSNILNVRGCKLEKKCTVGKFIEYINDNDNNHTISYGIDYEKLQKKNNVFHYTTRGYTYYSGELVAYEEIVEIDMKGNYKIIKFEFEE